MKNLFIISALHHLIQVDAVVKEMGLSKKNVHMFFFTNALSEDITIEVLKLSGYENYKIFEYWNFKEIFLRNKHIQYIKYLKLIENCDNLFISQYSSDYSLLACEILKPKRIFLLDEGTASFKVSKERCRTFFFNPKFFVKSFLYGKLITLPKKITYYTQYDLGINLRNDDVIKYHFTKEENEIEFDQESIFILGSSIAEVNIISINNYMELIMKIREKYNGSKVFYYPHRKERKEKINAISKLNIEIIESNIPFEFYYKSLKSTPFTYYSFYSPVLDNLSKQFQYLPHLNIIKLEKKIVLKNHQIIEDIYKSYLKNNRLNLVLPTEF